MGLSPFFLIAFNCYFAYGLCVKFNSMFAKVDIKKNPPRKTGRINNPIYTHYLFTTILNVFNVESASFTWRR